MTKNLLRSINNKLVVLLNNQKLTFFIIFIFYILKIISSLTFYMNDPRTTFELSNSFGGYIVGNYASLYPQHLKKVIMLSPIGVINKFNPEDKTEELI